MNTITSKELDGHPDLLGKLDRYRVLVISDDPDKLALQLDHLAWKDTFYGCVFVADKGKMMGLAKEIAKLSNSSLD